ncbi:MAG TPA: hypothetical protein VJS69_05025 [Candidatus Krumholzibacteria bacterium]|nr:hypothetical protein [Candidatus Krumholzibacteria bacterium]
MEPSNIQTESHTDCSTPVATISAIYTPEEYLAHMAAKRQPCFVLLAQDITADIVVDFWIKVQQRMREHVKHGLTEAQAAKAVREYYFLEKMDVTITYQKLAEACAIAGAMENWGTRRLAD